MKNNKYMMIEFIMKNQTRKQMKNNQETSQTVNGKAVRDRDFDELECI